jgi:predicted nucleic acid-binding protein
MAFVLDASVTVVWAMLDETHPVADLAFQRLDTEGALVPAIWWYEIRNILLVNERRQRISLADSTQFLDNLQDYPIEVQGILDHTTVAELARQYGLTIYDAAYLDLALRHHLPIATLDKALQAAAEAAGVPLLA